MDNKDHDKVFFVNFGAVLAALGAIFVICITAARLLIPAHETSPEALAQLEERIQPIGKVVTDPAALVKVKAKAAREPYSGEEVLTKACDACHIAGVMNAPKIGDKGDWSTRMSTEGGLDGLVDAAIHGKNAMPPRGGNPDLSDDEIKAAVKLMLEKAGI